jgi:predicted enzyme related to lactoylglutathione lyase
MLMSASVATRLGLAACLALLVSCASPSRIDTSGMSFSKDPLIGKVIWNDLITEDVGAARAFYQGMFGWTFEDTQAPGGGSYVLARSGNTYVAGMVPVKSRADGQELSRWLPYVSVADVDAAVARATSMGAKVAVGARSVGLGRVAAIIDPEGAVIGLAHSSIGDPDDATTAPGAGRVTWTELISNEPRSAETFYASVVGYQPQEIERRGGEYTMLTSLGAQRAGILRNPTGSWSPAWLTSFGVVNVTAAAQRAESLGGKLLLPPSPGLRENTMAIVADPAGAILVLQQLKN